jgi:uncharacterized pyridoxal phosphate-dependent enzyme
VIYERLGVRPVVNASATLTRLGGSLMPPPVLEAMNEAAATFVDLAELQEHAGRRIAELTGNQAAYISSGAAAGITLTVATCIAGADPANRYVFPELPDVLRTEVLCHQDQASPYRYAANLTGAQIVEVGGGLDEFAAAISERTACILWFAGSHLAGNSPPLPDVIAVARKHGVPVIVDAAAQVPPISSLWYFTRDLGADAVIFSGGKGLRGPQSSGLVLGREQIIEGCRVHGNPNHAIGRPMKAGKEEIAGLVAAVEWSLTQDEPATLARYERIVQEWIDGLRDIPGITVERGYPSEAGQPHGRAIVTIEGTAGLSRDELIQALWELRPRVAVAEHGERSIALNPQTLEPGEEGLVLEAIRSVLTGIGA